MGVALTAVPASSPLAQAEHVANRQIALIAALGEMQKRDRFGIPAEELAAWEEWAALAFAAPDLPPAVEAETHLGLAIARFYAKQYEAGLQAAQAAGAVPLPPRRRTSFATELEAYTALLLLELDQLNEAEAAASRAMAEAQASQLANDLALALNASANLAFARNDLPAALSGFCEARDLGRGDGWADPGMVVTNASSCAALNYYLETPETLAAVRISRDYALANLPPDHGRMNNILNTSYAILLRHGRYGEAQQLVQRHLELERRLHPGDADDVYDPLSMLARVRERLGAGEDAAELFAAAAAMAERLASGSAPYTAGMARSNEARVLAQLGRFEQAEAQARRGLDRLMGDVAPDDWHIGSVQVQLADILARRDNLAEGLALVDQGLALLRAKLPAGHSEVLQGELVRAQVLARMGKHGEALELARGAAALLEARMFDLAAGEQGQVALEAVLAPAFGRYLDVALRADGAEADAAEDAVHAAQLQLLSGLAVTNARIAGARAAQEEGIGALLEALEQAQARLAQGEEALIAAQSVGAQGQAELAASVQAARAQAMLAESALAQSHPDWAALTRPPVASLAQLQQGLAPGQMLVLPVALADRAITLGITADQFVWGQSTVRPDELAGLSQRLRRTLASSQSFDAAAAHALFGHVFPEALRPMLDEAQQLLFPASGYLARIPPGLLLTSDDAGESLTRAPWLIRTHGVTILASLVPARKPARNGTGMASFLGIGAPSAGDVAAVPAGQPFRLDLAPLPAAEAELAALAKALNAPEAQIITGAGATETAFSRALRRAGGGVIAFATHGLVGGEVPGLAEPALLLAPDPLGNGPLADGLLTASEIGAMRIDADWVILSACNSAAGTGGSAPVYSGLANAFTQAGAGGLLLSHWPVRDDAAAFLSVETLRRAGAGMPRAEALRQAQLALIQSGHMAEAAHPAIWAPFVMVEN